MKTVTAIACAVSVCAGMVNAATLRSRVNETPKDTSATDAVMLDRFLNSGHPPLTSYRARRVLSASTMGGRMRASLEAWTALHPDGTFSFDVIWQDGSPLIRKRVLLAALETEQRTRNHGETAQSELTTANYEFQVDNDAREHGLDRLATVRLFPRRKTSMLLNGTATVRWQDGDIVRIDGSPSKSPSWWTKHINIVRRYRRITGVRVPIEMGSQAEVRIAGKSTFSMIYDYESVNGVLIDKAQDGVAP